MFIPLDANEFVECLTGSEMADLSAAIAKRQIIIDNLSSRYPRKDDESVFDYCRRLKSQFGISLQTAKCVADRNPA